MDNGQGRIVPVTLWVSLKVVQDLFFGQYPIQKISGFKDEISGGVIANAFTVGLLDPGQVEKCWRKLEKESDAPIKPVLTMQGLVGWDV
jgi:hypothetical protein